MYEVQVIVPFDGETPKTRLRSVMDLDERRQFARAMLRDVLRAIREAGASPLVLSRSSLNLSVPVCVDERPLSAAVNTRLRTDPSEAAVVMADLPLVTARSLKRLFGRDGDVVLAYGVGGGTNALVARHPEFRVDYHDGSYHDHLANAREIAASVAEVDSFRLGFDIDEPADLAELLLYGDGNAVAWLRRHGFTVTDDERRQIRRRTMDAKKMAGRIPEEYL